MGLLARLLSAASGYGFVASDDCFNHVEPGWRWLQDPSAPLPSDFRSGVPSLIVYALMALCRALGVEQTHLRVQGAYALLGVISLVTIGGAWRLARPVFGERAAVWAAYAVALQAWMPRMTTRALTETLAHPWFVLGLLALMLSSEEHATRRFRWAVAAGFLLGSAVMLRLLLAAAAPGVLLALVLVCRRHRVAVLPLVAGVTLGGAVPLLAQGLLDQWLLGEFFAYPRRYVDFNLHYATDYGAEPWFTYVGILVLYTLPPMGLLLWRQLWNAARAHLLVALPLLSFLVVHSAVAHKEDRYMLPVLPLLALLLGVALEEAWRGTRWQRLVVVAWWVGNVAWGGLLTLSDEFVNITHPLVEVANDPDVLVLGVGALKLPAMYGNGDSRVRHADEEDLLIPLLPEPPPHRVRWVALGPPTPHVQAWLDAHAYRCQPPKAAPSGAWDRLLYAVNPSHNGRRAPSTVVDCARP
jgi:4-amino-4-deoxy-L-arabinose transferase-like glycosyltransferase